MIYFDVHKRQVKLVDKLTTRQAAKWHFPVINRDIQQNSFVVDHRILRQHTNVYQWLLLLHTDVVWLKA